MELKSIKQSSLVDLSKDFELWRELQKNSSKILANALGNFAPPVLEKIIPWAEKNISLPSSMAADSGNWSIDAVPALRSILEALDDPKVSVVVCQKPAQIGWTVSIIALFMCYRAATLPGPLIALFPRSKSATDFEREKLSPMVAASKILHDIFDMRPRSPNNTRDYKGISNGAGFIKLLSAQTPADVKSTSAAVAIVEEPDDCLNAGEQGDSIAHLMARMKTFIGQPFIFPKVLIGGTATIDEVSQVQYWMKKSNQCKGFVPCHDCGDEHVLDEANLKWDEYEPEKNRPADEKKEDEDLSAEKKYGQPHEIYGYAVLNSAYYACPCCGSCWDDQQLNENILNVDFRATRELADKEEVVAGFYLSEFYSTMAGSSLKSILKRKLEAQYRYNLGDSDKLIEYTNNVLGLPWTGGSQTLDKDILLEKANKNDYPLGEVPEGGCFLIAGVDVQWDALAVVIRAYGPGMESWLVWAEHIYGDTLKKDDPVWGELTKLLTRPWKHQLGFSMRVQSVGIDASDGHTSSNVYSFVKTNANKIKDLKAVKGSSNDTGHAPIFAVPKKLDMNYNKSKASKYGLKVYIVGTQKIQTILSERMVRLDKGAGAFHISKHVEENYFDHVTSHIKAPKRTGGSVKDVWIVRAGRRDEYWDCETYILHSAYGIGLHRWDDKQWEAAMSRLRQSDLFGAEKTSAASKTSGGGFASLNN